jgi:hypothetical protein
MSVAFGPTDPFPYSGGPLNFSADSAREIRNSHMFSWMVEIICKSAVSEGHIVSS